MINERIIVLSGEKMSRLIYIILKSFFAIFFHKKYLIGKHFETSKIGFVWCIKSLPYLFKLRRKKIFFPVGHLTRVSNGKMIDFDPSSLNVFQQPGCYFQDSGALIKIGKDVHIAANVGLITQNHDPLNPEKHLKGKPIIIGDYCWIGMNSVILPGVTLGDHTTVGAGSIVTHSFEGNCIIAGNPAKIIRTL